MNLMDWLPWALLVMVIALAWHNPFPIPFRDRGHRCMGVPNEDAAVAVGRVLALCRLRERYTFDMESDAGTVIQTVFDDDRTVLMRIRGVEPAPSLTDKLPERFGPCALSLTTWNPHSKAVAAAEILHGAGFVAEVLEKFVPSLGGKFVVVRSNAFDGWDLAFRRPVPFMGKPPEMRKTLG